MADLFDIKDALAIDPYYTAGATMASTKPAWGNDKEDLLAAALYGLTSGGLQGYGIASARNEADAANKAVTDYYETGIMPEDTGGLVGQALAQIKFEEAKQKAEQKYAANNWLAGNITPDEQEALDRQGIKLGPNVRAGLAKNIIDLQKNANYTSLMRDVDLTGEKSKARKTGTLSAEDDFYLGKGLPTPVGSKAAKEVSDDIETSFIFKAYQNNLEAKRILPELMAQDNPMADYSAVVKYVKSLDDSVVRDSERKAYETAMSIFDSISGKYFKAIKGESAFPSEVKSQFLAAAKTISDMQDRRYADYVGSKLRQMYGRGGISSLAAFSPPDLPASISDQFSGLQQMGMQYLQAKKLGDINTASEIENIINQSALQGFGVGSIYGSSKDINTNEIFDSKPSSKPGYQIMERGGKFKYRKIQ